MKSLVSLPFFLWKQIRSPFTKTHEDKTIPEPETDNNKLQITYSRTFKKKYDLDILLVESMRY